MARWLPVFSLFSFCCPHSTLFSNASALAGCWTRTERKTGQGSGARGERKKGTPWTRRRFNPKKKKRNPIIILLSRCPANRQWSRSTQKRRWAKPLWAWPAGQGKEGGGGALVWLLFLFWSQHEGARNDGEKERTDGARYFSSVELLLFSF